MVGQSWENPSDWFLTNSFSTIKFYNHLSKLDFKFRLIHISTPEVYGNTTKKLQKIIIIIRQHHTQYPE